MKLGIVSDTHNFLDPQVSRVFAGVDHILHGGDIGSRTILAGLDQTAPVTAVSGNTDDPAMGYRRTEVIQLGTRRFLVHHIVNPERLEGSIQEQILAEAPDVVVFGHTHKPYELKIGSILFINPGYAGKPRFGLMRSVAILHCTGKAFRVEFIPL